MLFFAAVLMLAPLPAFAQEQIMLETASEQSTFTVELKWTSADIGSENTFEIRFIEPETEKEVEDVIYDFGIAQGDSILFMRTAQDSNVQTATFDEVGSYTILVDNIDGLGEGASFSVHVTPEFPLALAMPAAFIALFALRKKFAG